MTRRHDRSGQSLRMLRSANTSALLTAVRNHGPISRGELGKITGLAPSSITRLARELERAGLIRELSKGQSSGGRQPALLGLNGDAGLVVGIDLSSLDLRGGVVDATGAPIVGIERPFDGVGPERIRQQLEALVQALIQHPTIAGRKLLGIGISVPGSVDLATGAILDSTNLHLRDFPVRELLQRRFGLPVFLEHDTAAAALAEQCYGAGRGAHNLIYITVSSGIGAGIIIGDEVYRGERGVAGELGHITVERAGLACPCGKRGCLETVASASAIVASARRVIDHRSQTLMAGWLESGQQRLTVDAVARAAKQGDRIAREILSSAADYLAMAIGTLVCMLDIGLIIVGGEVAQAGAAFIEPLQHSLAKYQLYSNMANIVPAQLEQDAALRGVCMLVLQQVVKLAH